MIVLVGFMGAGKTTVGRVLARRLGLPFVDTDDVIIEREGRGVPEIFTAEGETYFRDLEEKVIAEVLSGPTAIVSLGGGACGRQATRDLLGLHDTVHLRVSLAETLRRTGNDPGRPMLARPDLAEIFAGRQDVYAGVARRVLDTEGRRAEDIADDLVAGTPDLSETPTPRSTR